MSLQEGGTAIWDVLGRPAVAAFTSFVLLYSGLLKIVAPGAAGRALVHFHVTRQFRQSVARALGGFEALLGGLILIPWTSRTASGAASLLFAVFAVLLLRALVRGERFACGCFGEDSRDLDGWTLVRASLLCVVAGLLAARNVGDAGVGLADVIVGSALLSGCVVVAGARRVLTETRALVDWRGAKSH